ncbi:unnamed protein product [Bursaphelenchus okinawaensis]|uniref:Protein YIPF n=1 Tax=Bursaphelenchus okinawaensis TaxID=465554 RepID=A0A811L556_9BILA|nr:unnamed protein product [Bursaphelenchus okinawaensis]CAG9117723.1 unnamed protein product [Bursaphelenchus okinawaensis]
MTDYYNNSSNFNQQGDNQWFTDPNAGWAQSDFSQGYNTAGDQSYDPYAQNQAQYSQQQQQNYYGNMFIPSAPAETSKPGEEDFENEPPLLEELGVNFDHIRQKTFAVLNPVGYASPDVIADQDLAGPLVFCLLFGASLLLNGRVYFGYIYGIGMLGCLGMYGLLNLLSEERAISFTCTASVLGYCLLPMSLLAILATVFSFAGYIGYACALAVIAWCSLSSAKLFSITLNMEGQKLLVAYPCSLLYAIFALLAIF